MGVSNKINKCIWILHSLYIRNPHSTVIGSFTCWCVKDGSLITINSLVTKLVIRFSNWWPFYTRDKIPDSIFVKKSCYLFVEITHDLAWRNCEIKTQIYIYNFAKTNVLVLLSLQILICWSSNSIKETYSSFKM